MAIRLKTFEDCLDFVKRRKYYIVVTWLLFSIISVMVAYKLPKTFRSTATLLIEAPIPSKILENLPLQYADEQLQSIYQRVMTTDNVYSIIESAKLYEAIKDAFTKHELVEFFKESTDIELAASALNGKASAGIAEIAVNISFSDSDPVKAREIASRLAEMFIDLNDKSRTKRAGKATDFLKEESDKLNKEIEDIDKEIVKYKEEHNFSLPEQIQGNLAAIDRVEVELRDAESQIRSTKERIVFLSAELARTEAEQPISLDNKTPLSKEDAIAKFRADYLRASQLYSPNHPTLQRLKRELKALDPAFEGRSDISNISNELIEAKDELKLKEKTYSASHPDIIKLKKQISKLEKRDITNSSPYSLEQPIKPTRLRNPAYLNLEAQYKSSQSELQSLLDKQGYLKGRLEKLHSIVTVAPQVEMGYSDLIRERDNIIKKYTQLKEKLADAKVFQTLEEGQQGQTLTMIEAPVVPVHPEKAIRRKVAIGGFFLGLFAGFALAFALEFLDPAVRGYRSVTEITGLTPLVVIPYIESPEEEANKQKKQRRLQKIIVWSLLIIIVIVSVVAVSFLSLSY